MFNCNGQLLAILIIAIPIAFITGAMFEDMLDFLPFRNRHRRRRKKKK